jgi:hypothetical protein
VKSHTVLGCMQNKFQVHYGYPQQLVLWLPPTSWPLLSPLLNNHRTSWGHSPSKYIPVLFTVLLMLFMTSASSALTHHSPLLREVIGRILSKANVFLLSSFLAPWGFFF